MTRRVGLIHLYLSTVTFFPSLLFLFRRKTPLSIYCPWKQTTLSIPTDKISLAHWIQGSPVMYRVEPWHSFEFCNIALASACMHRHLSNCSPVFILSLILFSHLSHPPWLQFKNCDGVPLYPVDMIRLFLVMTAPNCLTRQEERLDIRLATCIKYSSHDIVITLKSRTWYMGFVKTALWEIGLSKFLTQP